MTSTRVRSLILIAALVGHVGAGALLLSLDSLPRRAASTEPPLVVTIVEEPRFAAEREAAQPVVLAKLPPLHAVIAPDSPASVTESAAPTIPRIDWMAEAARSACNVIARQEPEQIPLMCKRR